jgi:5'-methylthioadenosine phosphorylase
MFRAWGADVINMSIATEATLAREAGLCYAAVAMSTDYDCWHESETPVTWEEVCKTMEENADKVKQLFLKAVARIEKDKACQCKTAIDAALS